MAIEIILRTPTDIESAVDQLHDWLFDLDAIEWDKQTHQIRIPFSEHKRRLAVGKYEKILVVVGVLNMEICDTEKIGFYDLNIVTFESRKLVFKSEVPLHFSVTVNWGLE